MEKRILIVDDEPGVLRMVESRLKANGYETFTALSGKEGLEKCRQLMPDLVILDILMPDMDGSAVAAEIQEDPETNGIPILFLTAVVKTKEVPKDHIIGGQYFLAKPFKSEELLAMLRRILSKK